MSVSFQRPEPRTELDDVRLYGNAYTTKAGERLDPTRIIAETEADPDNPHVYKIVRYRYRISPRKEIVFPAAEVIRRTE